MAKLNLIKLFDGQRTSFFPIYLMDLAATSSVKKLLGAASGLVVNFYQQTDVNMYTDKRPWQKISDIAQKKLIKNKSFYRQIRIGMIKECERMEEFSHHLLKIRPENLTNQQLIKIYKDFEKRTLDLRAYAWIPNLVDMGTKSIFEIAEEEIRKQIGPDPKIKEYVSKLTTPTEITQQRQHELNLYKIQSLIQNKKIKDWQNNAEVNKLIEDHFKEYTWLAYYYIGPAWDKKDIIEIIKNNLKLIKNPQDKIKEIKNYAAKINKEKKALYKKFEKNTLLLLDKISAMIFLKAYRKEFLIYSTYCFEPILKEIGTRLGFSLGETRFITREELENYLLNKKLLTKKIREEIKNRFKKGCVSVANRGKIKIITLKEGEKYLKFIKKEAEIETEEIKGSCAYPGKRKGIAKIINIKEEIGKIKKGEILVSRATNPDLIVAMQKATAFVTDMGGITCHAAIVAREMKKPCVIGTKIASKLIQDGDFLEVDAGSGIVIILKKAKK